MGKIAEAIIKKAKDRDLLTEELETFGNEFVIDASAANFIALLKINSTLALSILQNHIDFRKQFTKLITPHQLIQLMDLLPEVGHTITEKLSFESCLRRFKSFSKRPKGYTNAFLEVIEKHIDLSQFLMMAEKDFSLACWALLNSEEIYKKFSPHVTTQIWLNLTRKYYAINQDDPNIKEQLLKINRKFNQAYLAKELEEFLFRDRCYQNPTDHHDHAKMYAMSQIYTLLSNPKSCLKYFKYINDEVEKYYQATHKSSFPDTNQSTYSYKKINPTITIVYPNENYEAIKKDRALPEILMKIFQQHGIGDQAYQWSGFVHPSIADDMIASGDFVTEGLEDAGLIHGKHSHALQIAIILLAIQDGRIKLDYFDNNKKHIISIREILSELVNSKIPSSKGGKNLLWAHFFDKGYKTDNAFHSPGQLNAFLMQPNQKNAFPALSSYIIDSFCTRFLKMLTIHQIKYPELTIESFLEKLCKEETHIFNNEFDLAERVKDKNRIVYSNKKGGRYFSVIKEKYAPDPNYTPNMFGEIPQKAPQDGKTSSSSRPKNKK